MPQKAHIREQRDAQTKIQTLQRDIDKVRSLLEAVCPGRSAVALEDGFRLVAAALRRRSTRLRLLLPRQLACTL